MKTFLAMYMGTSEGLEAFRKLDENERCSAENENCRRGLLAGSYQVSE